VKNAGFCASHELACLKDIFHFSSFGQLATFWLGIFVMLFHANRSLVGHETLIVYFVIKASKLFLRDYLELMTSQLTSATISYNIKVELGACTIILQILKYCSSETQISKPSRQLYQDHQRLLITSKS